MSEWGHFLFGKSICVIERLIYSSCDITEAMTDLNYQIDSFSGLGLEGGNDLQYFKIIRLSKHLEAGLGKNVERDVEEQFFFLN